MRRHHQSEKSISQITDTLITETVMMEDWLKVKKEILEELRNSFAKPSDTNEPINTELNPISFQTRLLVMVQAIQTKSKMKVPKSEIDEMLLTIDVLLNHNALPKKNDFSWKKEGDLVIGVPGGSMKKFNEVGEKNFVFYTDKDQKRFIYNPNNLDKKYYELLWEVPKECFQATFVMNREDNNCWNIKNYIVTSIEGILPPVEKVMASREALPPFLKCLEAITKNGFSK